MILTAAQWLTIVVGPLAILLAKTWKARLGLVGSLALVYVLTTWAAGWSDHRLTHTNRGMCSADASAEVIE